MASAGFADVGAVLWFIVGDQDGIENEDENENGDEDASRKDREGVIGLDRDPSCRAGSVATYLPT